VLASTTELGRLFQILTIRAVKKCLRRCMMCDSSYNGSDYSTALTHPRSLLLLSLDFTVLCC